MFDTLSRLACGWVHRENVISTWGRVSKSLTLRVLNILYGTPAYYTMVPHKAAVLTAEAKEAAENFNKNQAKYVVILPHQIPNVKDANAARIYNIADEQVIYFWFRFLFLFERRLNSGDKKLASETNQVRTAVFNEPEGYRKYVKRLSALLSEFASVGVIVKRPIKTVDYDLSDVDKANKNRIAPKFCQSPAFAEELNTLYS